MVWRTQVLGPGHGRLRRRDEFGSDHGVQHLTLTCLRDLGIDKGVGVGGVLEQAREHRGPGEVEIVGRGMEVNRRSGCAAIGVVAEKDRV